MGAAASAGHQHLSHGSKTAQAKKRTAAKNNAKSYHDMIVDKYDKNKDGVLDKGEVKSMCEHIMEEISPGLGGVTDEDVELVMRLGGAEAKDTIQPEEVPKALSLVLAIKKEKLLVAELFDKHDTEKTGKLPQDQVSVLLAEINEGIIPAQSDIDHVMAKCTLTEDGCVTRDQIRAAIAAWYFLVEQTALPQSVEEAKAMGYTDEQIAHFVKEMEEEAAIQAQVEATLEKDDAADAAAAAAAAPAAEEATPAAEAAAPAAEAALPVAEAPVAAEASADE